MIVPFLLAALLQTNTVPNLQSSRSAKHQPVQVLHPRSLEWATKLVYVIKRETPESQSPHTGHRLPPSEVQRVRLNFVIHRKIPAGHEPQRAANGRHKTQEHACPRTFLRARATICHAQYAERPGFSSISWHFKSEAVRCRERQTPAPFVASCRCSEPWTRISPRSCHC